MYGAAFHCACVLVIQKGTVVVFLYFWWDMVSRAPFPFFLEREVLVVSYFYLLLCTKGRIAGFEGQTPFDFYF